MRKTVRDNVHPAYSLHDMNVIAFKINDNHMEMHTQSGIIRVKEASCQVDGYVEFDGIDWDFSYVYLLDFTGNVGKFTGEKLFLKDFITKISNFSFSIIDEVYGYHQTKFWGYLSMNRTLKECIIEIYHTNNMVYVEK